MLTIKTWRHKLLLKRVFLLTAIPLHVLCSFATAEPLSLFNESEVQQLNYSQDEWVIELTRHQSDLNSIRDTQAYSSNSSQSDRGQSPGPLVSIIDPESEGDVYKSSLPLRLLIYLKSRLAPINIETLTVKGKRGIFTLNITSRIKSFMRQPQGDENADYVIDANIPKLGTGRYLITLSLADIDGNQEEHKAFLEVR